MDRRTEIAHLQTLDQGREKATLLIKSLNRTRTNLKNAKKLIGTLLIAFFTGHTMPPVCTRDRRTDEEVEFWQSLPRFVATTIHYINTFDINVAEMYHRRCEEICQTIHVRSLRARELTIDELVNLMFYCPIFLHSGTNVAWLFQRHFLFVKNDSLWTFTILSLGAFIEVSHYSM